MVCTVGAYWVGGATMIKPIETFMFGLALLAALGLPMIRVALEALAGRRRNVLRGHRLRFDERDSLERFRRIMAR